jgi:hypothetical protein
VEGVTVIELFLGMKQGDPLGSPLFILAHYQVFLKTIMRTPNYVVPSLVDETHILRPMNEIPNVFYHFLTQLALVRLRVKVSKCKL